MNQKIPRKLLLFTGTGSGSGKRSEDSSPLTQEVGGNEFFLSFKKTMTPEEPMNNAQSKIEKKGWGGARKGAGMPKGKIVKAIKKKKWQISSSSLEHEQIRENAKKSGMNVSRYIVERCA